MNTKNKQIKTTYSLEVGRRGQERLKILNETYNPYTLEIFDRFNIYNNSKVLTMGCGLGLLEIEMAKRVEKLIAIDSSEEQLNIARENAENVQCKNITFKKLDAYAINQLKESFDIIHCRFLLSHLTQPWKVIRSAYHLLNDKGILFIEEMGGNDSLQCHPDNPAYNRFKELCNIQFQYQKSDPKMGINLLMMFQELDLQIISRSFQPILTTQRQKSMLRLGVKEVGPKISKRSSVTLEDIQALEKDLYRLEKDPQYFPRYNEIIQIVGIKA